MKKILSLLLVFTILLVAGCQVDGGDVDNENPLVSVDITQSNQTIQVGGTVQLSAVKNPTTNTETLVWSSLNTAIATVSNTGLVTGVAAGGTIIKVASANGSIFDTITVTVTAEQSQVGAITWDGMDVRYVVAGNDIDVLEGVEAHDTVDGEITEDIVVLNDIDHEDELKANGWFNEYVEFESNLTGVYHVYYKVENSTGVVSYNSKQFVVEQGYNVVNGNFGLGKSFWTLDAPGGSATWSVTSDKVAKVSIANSGTEWWAIQLMQTVKLQANKTYKLSVTARSPQQKTMSFSFEDPTNGYRMLMGGVVVHRLTTEMKTYETVWTADANYNSAKAVLYLGHMADTDNQPSVTPDDVYIQRIKIEEVQVDSTISLTVPANVSYPIGGFTLNPDDNSGKPVFDPMAGVSATHNGTDVTAQVKVLGLVTPNVLARTDYLLVYYVEIDGKVATHMRKITVTMDREKPWMVINDNFASWLAGWTVDMNQTNAPGSAANFSTMAEGLSIEMVKKGSAHWHMQIEQVGVRFEAGKTYTVEVKVKGSNLQANKSVAFEVAANTGAGFNTYGTAIKTVVLTEEFEVHSFTFTPSVNLNTARIGFQFGNVNVGTVIILEYFTIIGPAE